MQNLHNHLPKDLVAIVEEYSKDRTNYNIVLCHLGDQIVTYNINKHLFDKIQLSFHTYIFRKYGPNRKKTKKIGYFYAKLQRQRSMRELEIRFRNT